jgi:LacI family transcriptional regulator
MASQREIAARAGTSLKTVSRVINRDPLVNAGTRARIEAIIEEIGYEPSQAARMMRSQRSDVIGFLADGVATTSSSIDLIRGAQDAAWERGKQMMLFNIEQDAPSHRLADSQLTAFRAEAVIYAARYHQAVRLPASSVPRILLNCFDPDGRHTAVVPDDYSLARGLANIVFARGYRRPVFLNLSSAIVAAGLRAAGISDRAREQGIDMAPRIHTAVEERDGVATFVANSLLARLMAAPAETRPDVIICGQDILAMDVYFDLAELGFKVGRDIAVVSFDNLEPVARLLKPGLSTMELPYYDMGRAAMLAAIDQPSQPMTIRLPGRFIDRASLAARPG